MELGSKIKQLRCKASLTQEQLAEELGITAQSISKWENSVSMPDISLLPKIAEVFGITIDELFSITSEQKLRRIENSIEIESELTNEQFLEYEKYLTEQLSENTDRAHILSLFAHLYHHRMNSDSRKVSRFAREAIKIEPDKKECQWLLQKSENATIWDWNEANHSHVIDFYKEVVKDEPTAPRPYYFLLDNLIADHRTKEASEYLAVLEALPSHKPSLIPIYKAHITLAEYDEKRADGIIEDSVKKYSEDSDFLFETAQYYARKCEYEKAVKYYERSYSAEEQNKPRFTDALSGIETIYEILGEYGKAAAVCDRIIDNLKNEWGMTDEISVQEAEKEKNRILQKINR